MRTYLLAAGAAVAAAVVAVPAPAFALVAVPFRPAPQRAATAEVVVVGKVTSIEKDTIDAPQFPGAPNKATYKIAVVKIETNLAGAKEITHIKVGFIPPAAPQPLPPGQPGQPIKPGIRPPRPGFQQVELKEGQEMLFFLNKHHSAGFYIMPNMSPPIDATTDAGKKEIEQVKKITEALADPMKGLKSDKADVRGQTAALLVMKYRNYPEGAAATEEVAIGADESKLILKALAEADWKQVGRPGGGGEINALQAFYMLGLNDKDGWKPPMFPAPQPGQPPVDFVAIQKEAFVKWLAGAGKDYQVKKIVAKKAEK